MHLIEIKNRLTTTKVPKHLILCVSFLSLNSVIIAQSRDLSDFTLGINVHGIKKEDLTVLEQLRIPVPRLDLRWDNVATAPEKTDRKEGGFLDLNAAETSFLKPLIILDYGNPEFDLGGRPISESAVAGFVNYAKSVVEAEYKSAFGFEVWNEWDFNDGIHFGKSRGAAFTYIRLLRSVYREIKTIHPEVRILAGSFADLGTSQDWLDDALRKHLLDYCDGLSAHLYIYDEGGRSGLPETDLLGRLRRLLLKLDSIGSPKNFPVYITELGWPTFPANGGVSWPEQSKLLARSIILVALEPRVKGVWIYEMKDDKGVGTDAENNFGIINEKNTVKDSFGVLGELSDLFRNASKIETVIITNNKNAYVVHFVLRDHNEAWLCWTTDVIHGTTLLIRGNRSMEEITGHFLGQRAESLKKRINFHKSVSLTDMPLVILSNACASDLNFESVTP